jgi:hypothetical protein
VLADEVERADDDGWSPGAASNASMAGIQRSLRSVISER